MFHSSKVIESDVALLSSATRREWSECGQMVRWSEWSVVETLWDKVDQDNDINDLWRGVVRAIPCRNIIWLSICSLISEVGYCYVLIGYLYIESSAIFDNEQHIALTGTNLITTNFKNNENKSKMIDQKRKKMSEREYKNICPVLILFAPLTLVTPVHPHAVHIHDSSSVICHRVSYSIVQLPSRHTSTVARWSMARQAPLIIDVDTSSLPDNTLGDGINCIRVTSLGD